MCMLFGLSARDEFHTNEYLKAFYKNSPKHPDGWGLGVIGRHDAVIERESIEASKSHYLKERLSAPIDARLLLAHIRYATVGNVEYRNCHPFSAKDNLSRRWTQAHNGTIFDYPALSRYVGVQKGDTDSERIFLYLLDRLNAAQSEKGGKLSFDERFDLLDGIVGDMAKGNKLNLLLTDGRNLYVHTNCKETLYYLDKGNAVLIATVPLTAEKWKPVPFTTLLAFRDGRLVKTGINHGNEYIENPEQMKLLYQIFSNL
ncbi:MAG: class II glutamine amidotransferase [Ruminococcus sp.]|nr:class II glutamine amidotransferase [Ruminococcus sp.]